MDEEKYEMTYEWETHGENIISEFNSYYKKGIYVDCALMCELRTIYAHKVILSACSGYFSNEFEKMKDEASPVLSLTNIRYKDLKACIDCMYEGKVNVDSEDLPSFLKTVEFLQLFEVKSKLEQETDNIQGKEQGTGKFDEPKKAQKEQPLLTPLDEKDEELIVISLRSLGLHETADTGIEYKIPEKKNQDLTDTQNVPLVETQKIEESVEEKTSLEDITTEEEKNKKLRSTARPFACEQCPRRYKHKKSLVSHLKYECGKSPSFECPYCTKKVAQKGNLKTHVKRNHPKLYRKFIALMKVNK